MAISKMCQSKLKLREPTPGVEPGTSALRKHCSAG